MLFRRTSSNLLFKGAVEACNPVADNKRELGVYVSIKMLPQKRLVFVAPAILLLAGVESYCGLWFAVCTLTWMLLASTYHGLMAKKRDVQGTDRKKNLEILSWLKPEKVKKIATNYNEAV